MMKPPIMNYNDQIQFNFEIELFKELTNHSRSLLANIDTSELIATTKYLAYEEERARFSMELHDHFGQELNVLKGLIDLLGFDMIGKDQKDQLLNEIHLIIKSLITETRTLAFNLSPSTFLESDLNSLLVQLFKRINLSLPNCIQFELPNTSHLELNQVQKQFVYRVIQEFISNSIKHSGSKVIIVKVAEMNNLLTVVLKDEGCGFNLKKQRTGSGVSNIYKRLELLKADYFWQSSRKNGTQLTFTIYANTIHAK